MTDNLVSIAQPNAPAPDFVLVSSTGERVKLSDYRDTHNVVLFFLRAFSCMQCRLFARRLVESHAEISARFGRVIIIGPGTKTEAEKLAKAIDPENKIAILHDGTGEIYDRYKLNKVLFSSVQKSAVLIIDKTGLIRHVVQTANATRWVTEAAVSSVLKELDPLVTKHTTQTIPTLPPTTPE
jgi:peroxiredoxin